MRILVQWSLDQASDWVEVPAADWWLLPVRPTPRGGERLGGGLGYVTAICVQGMAFSADHYAVLELAGGIVEVTCWSDDLEDGAEPWGQVVRFHPLAPDPALGGAYNTRQEHTLYVGPRLEASLRLSPVQGTLMPWACFAPPGGLHSRHGIWLPDGLYEEHVARRSIHGWREWTDGLPAEEVVDGRLRYQRPVGRWLRARGTQTYYASSTDLANGIHAATYEKQLLETPSSETGLTSAKLLSGSEVYCYTTAANRPKSAAWPTGEYRHQIDCTAATSGAAYGLTTAGAAVGHFARVNAALSSDLETKAQTAALYTGTGLKAATTGSVSWSSGSSSDRFECLIAGYRYTGHAEETITVDVNGADDYADGPWAEITTSPPTMMFNF